jgi:hypothetical protein
LTRREVLRREMLRQDEIAAFRRDGYVAVGRPAVPAPALAQARSLLDQVFGRPHDLPGVWLHDLSPGKADLTVPEIINTSHLEPRLLTTPAYWIASRAAARVLGMPVRLAFDHAIFKPGGVGDRTPLHQDLAFNPAADLPTATVWLALVDANTDNGCMCFVPGERELLSHHRVGRDALQVDGFSEIDTVTCPVPAGGFTLHSHRTIHGSGPNYGSEVRATWIMKFVADSRSRKRRLWERSLELRGVPVPHRKAELASAFGAGGADGDPDWATGPSPL